MAGIEAFYDILGLQPMASAEAIRAAYRAKARQVHPDVAGAAGTTEFVRLNVELILGPETAHIGSDVRLVVPVTVICRNCRGSGLAEPFVCPQCRGRGHWTEDRRVWFFLQPPIRDGQTVTVKLHAADVPVTQLHLHIRLSWL